MENMMLSPPNQSAINAWINFLTPIGFAIVAVVQIISARLAALRDAKAQATAKNLTQKLDVADTKLTAVHTLVNSEHGTALKLAATALAKVAALTKDPGDLQQAADAKAMADEHDRNQAAAAPVPTTPAAKDAKP
jgi:hypothetical protein